MCDLFEAIVMMDGAAGRIRMASEVVGSTGGMEPAVQKLNDAREALQLAADEIERALERNSGLCWSKGE